MDLGGKRVVNHWATVVRINIELGLRVTSRVHDAMTFYWSSAALRSDREVVGFYFDRNGFPQQILRGTTYGLNIERWEGERKPS